jgi:NADH:ubiquinone oxidoreductase subunit 5 (subunit L)/multisubunit Na+/H+ antiporter MnhA subunit
MEHDIKRLLAYHSIENIGIILMGMGITFTAVAVGNTTLAALAMLACLFHTLNHTIFKGALFLGAGSIQYATGTKDMEKLGGLIKKMPVTSVLFLVACLSISAIPPFNGFVSEWLTYQSLFLNIIKSSSTIKLISILAVAALAIAGAFAATCFVKCFGISFLGLARSKQAENAREVPISMLIGPGLLSALCLLLGLFPVLGIGIIDKVNKELLGVTALQHVSGNSFMLFYPLKAGANSINPLFTALLILLLIIFTLIFIRLFGGKKNQRSYGTWDCGFKALTPRMQYTATGFSKPIRIVFRAIFRPSRELEVEEGATPYTPKSMRYIVSTEHPFEKYLYRPVYYAIKRFSRKLGAAVQTGSLHAYLLYLFAAVLLLLAYYRIFGHRG